MTKKEKWVYDYITDVDLNNINKFIRIKRFI